MTGTTGDSFAKAPSTRRLPDLLEGTGFLCLGSLENVSLEGSEAGGGLHLALIGSTGPSIWPILVRSPEYGDGQPDPLDRYTRRVLTGIAGRLGCKALFPFEGPPYHPFQQWALACGSFSRSPMGVLAHYDYGPWSGFRAVFLSRQALAPGTPSERPGPCEACEEKPCIAACPAGALSLEAGYDVPKCRLHLEKDRTPGCWTGCLARRACPIGQDHRQTPDNARFHMESFIGLG